MLEPQFLSRIEDAGIDASAPAQQRWVDGWIVRLAPEKAKRARCIHAVADGVMPLAERMAHCSALYAEAGLPLIVRITPFSRPAGLDAFLERCGFVAFDPTAVMALADVPTQASPLPVGIDLRPVGLEAFAHRVGDFRGAPVPQRRAHASRLLAAPLRWRGFELHEGGSPVACAQFALEGELVGLYDVFTVASARGRGLAGLLCAHLLAAARDLGARLAYLQVEQDNAPARSVYRRLGFTDAYAYHDRALDPSAA